MELPKYEPKSFKPSRIVAHARNALQIGEVRRSLLAKRRVDWERGLPRGKLDTSRLADLTCGATDVFKRMPETTAVNAAVSVLVDCSGSMRHTDDTGVTSLETAWAAALTLANTLAIPGVALELIGFTTHMSRASEPELVHHPVKRYDDRLILSSPQLRDDLLMMYCLSHNNADAENLAISYADILQRKEPKKMIFILSDGEPETWEHEGCRTAKEATIEVINQIQADPRVQLYALGFGMASRMNYQNFEALRDVKELGPALLRLVKKRL